MGEKLSEACQAILAKPFGTSPLGRQWVWSAYANCGAPPNSYDERGGKRLKRFAVDAEAYGALAPKRMKREAT